VDALRKDIGEGKYQNWDEIHRVFGLWQDAYALDKARHAWAVLALLNGGPANSAETLKQEMTAAIDTRRWISDQIYQTRAKDFRDPFRKATFRNDAEMEQVLGKPEENSFVRLAPEESKRFEEMVGRVTERL
jgi:hypothetical protein